MPLGQEGTLTPDQARDVAAYIDSKLNDAEVVFDFITIKAEDVQIKWNGRHVHVDDEQITLKENTPVHVRIKKNALVFLK